MPATTSPLHIAILGHEESATPEFHGCGLWSPGYAAAVTAAGATPVLLGDSLRGPSWSDHLEGIDGVLLTGSNQPATQPRPGEDRLCKWCQKHGVPLVAVDRGMLALNLVYGGSVYGELSRELPEALQHRHPPEPGLRHAITVLPDTRLAEVYGEGEIVVNSEHRQAVERVARGFRVGGRALDGVVEAIEAESDRWFALGVQWRPASGTASGLDIQLFRGLVDACRSRKRGGKLAACAAA